MREIEFRAWNTQEKRYYYGVEHAYDYTVGCSKTGDFIPATSFGEIAECDGSEWIPEQYTGLKDESGEKIFKNDIFKLDGDEYNYLVVFKDGAFGFHGEITGDFFPFAEGALDIVDGVVQGLTIVGNTSGNLELLTQNENY